jgi:DNA mismatch repair ATPase MutL
MENAIEMQANNIEIKLYSLGIFGFDIIDDGYGIHESDFDVYVKCRYERKEN